jgi:hypothetical protein
MENSKNVKSGKVNINLSKIQNDLKESKKERSVSSNDLYVYPKGISLDEDKKKFRTKLRRRIHKFYTDICIYQDNLESDILEFMEFYKANYKIQDFKIENFSNSRNADNLKAYSKLLDIVKKAIS